MGGPKDGVGDEFRGFGSAPVPMKMATGKAEGSSPIGSFGRPSDVLQITASYGFANGGVPAMRTIRSVHGACRRNSGKDRCHPLHSFRKTHMKIPFIASLERCDAGGDRMLGQVVEFSIPMWIDRPIGLEVSAEPS